MRKVVAYILLFLILPMAADSAVYYIATTGDDGNDGSFANPWKTVEHITGNVSPGDLVYLRGGIYRSTEPAGSFQRFQIYNLTGTASNYITIRNYPGEVVVFNNDDIESTNGTTIGMYISNCDYVKIYGIRVTGLVQNDTEPNSVIGLQVDGSYGVIVERCEVDHIGGYGVYNFNSDSTHWLNNDIHHCGDQYTGWGGANGFSCTGGDGSTNVTVEGNRLYWNSDDGFDLFRVDGVFRIINNWSFFNGYEPGTFTAAGDGVGFKLGPHASSTQTSTTRRFVFGNLAVRNRFSGIDENSAQMKFELYNNTVYGNYSYGVNFYQFSVVTAKNNIAYRNGEDIFGELAYGQYNTWFGEVTVTDDDFVSLDSMFLLQPRKPDGSLPDVPYLRLKSGSDMIDAGTDTDIPSSIPKRGAVRDMGAFETPWRKKPFVQF